MKIILIILAILVGIFALISLAFIYAAYKLRPKISEESFETTKEFTRLENVLLKEFYSLFDAELSEKMKAQIDYFKHKKKFRQASKKSMSIKLYGDDNNPLLETILYKRRDERTLATIKFKKNNIKYTVEFNNYHGRIWGWKIRPNPQFIMHEKSIDITNTKIDNNPETFV